MLLADRPALRTLSRRDAGDHAEEVGDGDQRLARNRGRLAKDSDDAGGLGDRTRPRFEGDLLELLAIDPEERLALGWHRYAPELPGPLRAEQGLAEADEDDPDDDPVPAPDALATP